MSKMLDKTRKRDSELATRVQRTADIAGVSTRLVYMVINGQENIKADTREKVMRVFMSLHEGESVLIEAVKEEESLLIKSVKELVPFN